MSYPANPFHRSAVSATALRAVRALFLGLGLLAVQQAWAQNPAPAMSVEQQELRVNINEADAELIADILDGVGPSRARAIVEYREQHGRFESLEDLKAVSGVGDATIRNNRERITFE